MDVVYYTIRVSIPTEIEDAKGKTQVFTESELQDKASELSKELDEIGFAGILESAARVSLEEHALRFHPVVEVDAGA